MTMSTEPRVISRVRLIRELNQMADRLVRVHTAALGEPTSLLTVTQGVLRWLRVGEERALMVAAAIAAAGPDARVFAIDATDGEPVGLVAVPAQVDAAFASDDGVAFQVGATTITIQRETHDA